MKKRVLVAGATGLAGSAILEEFRKFTHNLFTYLKKINCGVEL